MVATKQIRFTADGFLGYSQLQVLSNSKLKSGCHKGDKPSSNRETRSAVARCDAIGNQANQDFLSHIAPSSARNVGTTCEPSDTKPPRYMLNTHVTGFAGGTNIACAGGRNVAQKVLVGLVPYCIAARERRSSLLETMALFSA